MPVWRGHPRLCSPPAEARATPPRELLNHLMKAHPLSARLLLTAAIAVLGICATSSISGASIGTSITGDTPLPAGWELCILQGVSAPATQANVADLDEWQLAEGGSTNNSAAYNPFNTARTTDVNNTPLPLTISANGFPAFTDWIAGCAATVATILQPNMTTIAAGLRAGDVSPPPAFLAVVDQSQWCAPSADGTPCYSDMIGGTTGSLAKAVLSASSALDVYGNVQSDLRAYTSAVTAVSMAQQTVTTTDQQLSAAQAILSTARNRASSAESALQHFAVNEYVSSGLYESNVVGDTSTGSSGSPSQNSVTAHQYATFVAAALLAQSQAATAAAKEAQIQRNAVAKTLQQDVTTLTSDNANESRTLVRLVADVTTLQKAGACTTAVITNPTPASSGAPAGSTTPSSPAPAATPSTTTTTTAPPAPTSPTSTTTSSTTTTTAPPGISLVKPPATTTTTTTTVPASTTTTSSSTTTTTTTVPAKSGSGTSTAAAPVANPVGLQVLQGCVTALAPSASA